MPDEVDEAKVLTDVISAFRPLSPEARKRLLQTVATFYSFGTLPERELVAPKNNTAPDGNFSEDRSASPKAFLHEKNPESEAERLVCLAYYLTHYRAIQHFKTLDLTQLNTEAAQIKLSNPSSTVHKASQYGLIAPAPGGQKQITARGERFVTLLPDRDAARAALTENRKARRPKRKQGPSFGPTNTE